LDKHEIKVKPTRQLFFNDDSMFGIFACNVIGGDENIELNDYYNISVKGNMPKLEINNEYTMVVEKDSRSNYKGSYALIELKKDKPIEISEQKSFLEALLTEKQVENIYSFYKETDDVIGMIEKDTFDYDQVKGIGEKTVEKIKEKIKSNMGLSDLLIFATKYGISNKMIANLIRNNDPYYVMEQIKKNVYFLTKFDGFGFLKADEIAKNIGFDMSSIERINACVEYVISEEVSSGNSWIQDKDLINKVVDLTDLSRDWIIKNLDEIKVKNEYIVLDKDRYAKKSVYEAEKYVAERLKGICQKQEEKIVRNNIFTDDEIKNYLDEYCKENNVKLDQKQIEFFYEFNNNNVMALIGNAGMGKSFLIGILINLIEKKEGISYSLMTPTGKSAKVLSGYTKREAKTIHREIGYGHGSENSEYKNPVNNDIIVVDEVSMCDVFLMKNLLSAITKNDAKILFVGDDEQLPSVSVGRFMYDMIESGVVPVLRLRKVFRQSEGGMLDIATKTRQGISFLGNYDSGRKVFGKDCVFWLVDQEHMKSGLIYNYKNVIKKFDPKDVLILTPTNKGNLGTVELNKEIQSIVNPPAQNKKEFKVGKKEDPKIYRVGDMVMNLSNKYDIETESGIADIFNGDTGEILDINLEEKVMIILIDGMKVLFPLSDVYNDLSHAWATTIHKSQGSGYDVVISVIDKSSTFQLNKNLLYTGLTRAKKYKLVLTQPYTFNSALKKSSSLDRKSFLKEFLTN
jgi:RecD/TraA family predicted helicase